MHFVWEDVAETHAQSYLSTRTARDVHRLAAGYRRVRRMSEPPDNQRPVIIVQQSQSQTQEGCLSESANGCGWGCLVFIIFAVLTFPIGMIGSGIGDGDPGSVVTGVGVALVEVIVMVVLLGIWLNRRTAEAPSGSPPPQQQRSAQQIIRESESNYGRAESPTQEKRGRWQPHPDDPTPPEPDQDR